jgi:Tol biopolymer transport system component
VKISSGCSTGSDLLQHNARGESSPAWSPDGRKIAFVSNSEIYVMNADGSEQRTLTQRGAQPLWSPDGRKIAFVSVRDGKYDEVHVMNADGSGKRNLTHNPAPDGAPAWSPDGRRIAFQSWRGADLYVMNADGTGQRNLTRTPGAREFGIAWSPGQKK